MCPLEATDPRVNGVPISLLVKAAKQEVLLAHFNASATVTVRTTDSVNVFCDSMAAGILARRNKNIGDFST